MVRLVMMMMRQQSTHNPEQPRYRSVQPVRVIEIAKIARNRPNVMRSASPQGSVGA